MNLHLIFPLSFLPFIIYLAKPFSRKDLWQQLLVV